MKIIPNKILSIEEVKKILSNPERLQKKDFLFNLSQICTAGRLYTALWVLTCASFALVKEYIQGLPDSDILLKIFNESGTKYVGKTLLAFGVELDDVKNLTPEVNQKVMQVLFEKMICAINESIRIS